MKIYVQYNRFAGTGALGTALSQTGWVQLQAALQEAQPWQQSLVGTACPLWGTGRARTGIEGDSGCVAISRAQSLGAGTIRCIQTKLQELG